MAVDVIARALAAKASQGGSGGGGNKVPIDISGAMDEVLLAIDTSYCPVRNMGFPFPEYLAKSIGGKIAAAGKDNVDLFFNQDGRVGHHSFTIEMGESYGYCFLLGGEQGLYNYVKNEGYPQMTLSLVIVVYNLETETMEGFSVFFISGDETPLYITGTKSRYFLDLASAKTILTYDGNQVIEVEDHEFKKYINGLLKGVMSIGAGDNLVRRIEHYENCVTPLYYGEYSRVSKEWAFVASIDEGTTSIVDNFKIYNGTLDIYRWAEGSTLKDNVSIFFSNGIPSQLVFTLEEEMTLTANTPLIKDGFIDKTIAEVGSVWENVVFTAAGAPAIFTTNVLLDAEGKVKTYYCSSVFDMGGIQLDFSAKENVTIPAGTQIVIKLS